MNHLYRPAAVACLSFIGSMLAESSSDAQTNLPLATAGEQVVIKREACRIIEAQKYRVPLVLEAVQSATLVAPFDGTIKQVAAKANAKVPLHGDVFRMDSTIQKLNSNRATQQVKLATIELKAAEKDEAGKELAQIKLDIAKIEAEIAQAMLEQASVKMPFAGEVQRILVSEGQFVRAGDPLAVVVDSRAMKVEIPIDRAAADTTKTFPIKIEQDEVEGKIDSVIPLAPKFEALRELFDSIASALIVVENPSGKYKVGQTVYVPLIPRQPVVEVANSSVGNLADGQRKVQVLRQLVVRDIPVKIMGQIGATRVYVSGPFSEGDEVIFETSHLVADGFQLKPSAASTASTTTNPSTTQPTTAPSTTPATKPVGF